MSTTKTNNHKPEDRTIIATADDAILAKLATVKAGYYDDPFLEPFSRHAAGIYEQQQPRTTPHQRQVQPIIKRGTHARVRCMDRAIAAFVDYHGSNSNINNSNRNNDNNTSAAAAATEIQVIVLGCGKDTSYFRHARPHVRWFEVDHSSVLQTKASIIQESPAIFGSTVEKTSTGFCVETNNNTKAQSTTNATTTTICHLIEHDLRDPPQNLIDKLQRTSETTGFDVNTPTLFLLECVLMYLPDDTSRTLLRCLTENFSSTTGHDKNAAAAYLCCYEPILGSDAFGTVMEQNLVKAGVAIPDSCLRTTRTLEEQLDKIVNGCGFATAVGCDMSCAYDSVLSQVDRSRANKCEFLDEVEEWLLIMRHYCFVVASSSTTAGNGDHTNDFAKYFCSVGPTSALGFIAGKSRTLVMKATK